LFAVAGLLDADPITGNLFYTRFAGGMNINRVSADYDGVTFTLGTPVNITTTPGADGIIFAPDGDLLIGGQGNIVHKVDPATGTFVSRVPNVNAFHLALDPSGDFFYAAGIPSAGVATVPLDPFVNGTFHALSGDDTTTTSIAFVGSQAYYTNAGPGGSGSFGRLDTTTFTTTRLITGLNAAHGMTFDPFTGDLIVFSGPNIAQIDPSTATVVSSRVVPGLNFDQGAADGTGHLFIASNTGHLFFMDYADTALIGDVANFTAAPFLAASLDDIAPLVGPGAPPGAVPEPRSVLSAAGGVMALIFIAACRKRSAYLRRNS
jgi:hypothetical protein